MNDRQKQIMDILTKNNTINILDLTEIFHYSESTIRRDLIKLEQLNLINRIPGGAVIANKSITETKTKIKSNIDNAKKKQLAEYAISMIDSNDTIFLDSSSTTYILGKKINKSKISNLVIYTTNLVTALEMSQNNRFKVYIFPGLIQDDIIVENYNNDFFDTLVFDKAFFSCKSFSIDFGTYEILEFESYIKKKVSCTSLKNYLLVDDTKLNKKSRYKTIHVNSFDKIITNETREINCDYKNIICV